MSFYIRAEARGGGAEHHGRDEAVNEHRHVDSHRGTRAPELRAVWRRKTAGTCVGAASDAPQCTAGLF
ncbi:hypothetical protein ACFVVQ_12375 [Paenibacillus chitinolyticus]|uniref:hypothetical protein n=1 Tax=Paenibacillus chitinolyticus TaxID=79263 RepID=UPI0036D7DCE8